MKKTVFLILSVFAALNLMAFTVIHDYKPVLSSNDYTVLIFTSPTCPWCTKLVNDLAANVDKINKNAVVVVSPVGESEAKAHFANSPFYLLPAAISLYSKFGIRGVPTTIVFNKEGKAIDMVIGADTQAILRYISNKQMKKPVANSNLSPKEQLNNYIKQNDITAVVFTGSRCPWCTKLIYWLRDNKDKIDTKKVVIITPLDLNDAKAKYGEVPFEFIKGNRDLYHEYAIRAVPTTVILDSNGKRKDLIIGAKLDEILKYVGKSNKVESNKTEERENTSQEEGGWWTKIWRKLKNIW